MLIVQCEPLNYTKYYANLIFNPFSVPPTVRTQYHLIGAYDKQQIILECHSQAYPKSINYWSREKGEIIPHSKNFCVNLNQLLILNL